jgi:hypothetical protein
MMKEGQQFRFDTFGSEELFEQIVRQCVEVGLVSGKNRQLSCG